MYSNFSKLTLVLIAGVALSGCSGIGNSSSQDISGKILTQGEAKPGEGSGCRPHDLYMQYLGSSGAEVKISDSTGKVVGVSYIEPHGDTNASYFATLEGDKEGIFSQCAVYFDLKDVVVEDDFYTIQFNIVGQQGGLRSVTVSRENLTGELVVNF